MKTFHHELLTGHTAAILEEIPAMVCDASIRIEAQNRRKWPISSHRLAGPYAAGLTIQASI